MSTNKKNKQAENNKNTKVDKKSGKYTATHAEKRRFFPTSKGLEFLMIIVLLIAVCFLGALIIVDVVPGDLMLILCAIMVTMLVLICLLFSSRRKWKRIIGVLLAIVFAVVFTYTTGFMGKTYALLNRISDTGTNATGPMAKTVDVTEEPFNLYITGIDQWAKEKGLDLERSDVNMIVTINPKTRKVLLTSIPRDTYVELYTAGQMDKLTHTGVYGVDETLNTVQKWLDIDLNYYVKMNFTGARDIINAMGGVLVYSPVDFTSSVKGYEYHKGWNDLTGKEAIYFARERKAFEGQDAARVENQQRVMKAIIKKMTSSTTLLTKYGEIMDAAGAQMQTNLSTAEMSSLAKMQITELASWDVQGQKIDGTYDQDYVASLTQSQKFEIYRPTDESVKECKDKINEIMNPSEAEIEEATKGRTKSFVINAVKRMLSPKAESEEVQ